MDTETPEPAQPKTPWSLELAKVLEEYMAEYRQPAEFLNELIRVFPNDQAFVAIKSALLSAMMPGDRNNVLHKSMNHMTILVAISVARSADQAVKQATAPLLEKIRVANEQVVDLLKQRSAPAEAGQ